MNLCNSDDGLTHGRLRSTVQANKPTLTLSLVDLTHGVNNPLYHCRHSANGKQYERKHGTVTTSNINDKNYAKKYNNNLQL